MRSLAILLMLTGLSGGQSIRSDPGIFPMQKGARWIYRGEVAWQTGSGRETMHRKRIDWTMEVTDTIVRGRYKAALISGHPADLMWYEEDRKPGTYLLIADRSKFHLREYKPPSVERLNLSETELGGLIDQENLILKLPLQQGSVFGGDTERTDGMYAWFVESVRPVRLRNIAGIPPGTRTEYTLTYRTLPDHQIATYVSGIGLTSFVYSHHGTVSDVDVRLVDFRSR